MKNTSKLSFGNKIFNEKQRALELIEKAKQNTQWRKQFMDFEHYMSLSFRQGKEEGEQIGAQKKAIEKNLELKEQHTVQA